MQWHSQTKERATENTNFNLHRRASPRPYCDRREHLEALFGFVKANQATHSVGTMYRVLKTSRSGYFARRKRPLSSRARRDRWLTGKIEAIHRRSRGVYGSPMIHAELADEHSIRVGRKRVARLMRAAGLRGATLRRFVVTTTADPKASRAIDRVDGASTPRRPIGSGFPTRHTFRLGPGFCTLP